MKLTATTFSIVFLFFVTPALAQDKWDLQRSVEYAWSHNVTIKQAAIQAGVDSLTLQQYKLASYPTASFNTNTGLQFGRSVDPTTNQFTTTQLLFQQYNFQTNVTIFNWGNIKNNALSARFAANASKMDIEKTKNDLGLSVAQAYLQALLSTEQINVAEAQLQQTQSQLTDTRKRVNAGALPELNSVQLEAQLASDSANLITAKANAQQNILSLKALLYLDAAAPFDIESPDVDLIPIDPISELQADYVFATAMKFQPAQKSNDLRIKSLEAAIKASRALLYPTIGAFGGLRSNFSSPFNQITGGKFVGYYDASPVSSIINVNGTNYPVQEPNFTYTKGTKTFGGLWKGWGKQLSNNFSQNFGISINVPIFNGGINNINYQRAKLNLQNAQANREQIDQKLKQDIYQAYNSATAALQKYNANQSTVNATKKAFDFATKRYNLGLLSTLDLITTQTNYTKAKLDLLTAHYDYVFKMKVLEFYKGNGIKLK